MCRWENVAALGANPGAAFCVGEACKGQKKASCSTLEMCAQYEKKESMAGKALSDSIADMRKREEEQALSLRGLHPVKRPAEIAWNVMAFIGRSWALRILPENFSREEGVLARRKPPSRGLSGKMFCTGLLKPSALWLRRFGMWSCAVVSCYFSGLFCASKASEVSVHSA